MVYMGVDNFLANFLWWYNKKTLANKEPKGEPTATPSTCL